MEGERAHFIDHFLRGTGYSMLSLLSLMDKYMAVDIIEGSFDSTSSLGRKLYIFVF